MFFALKQNKALSKNVAVRKVTGRNFFFLTILMFEVYETLCSLLNMRVFFFRNW